MAANVNHWKEAYQRHWRRSSYRERLVKERIEEETGVEIVDGPGLGVGSASFISGSAKDNGAERSGADLHITGTSIYIEVTGPLFKVHNAKPIWIRPDKIISALAHPDRRIWIVHCNFDNTLMRAIFLDIRFFQSLEAGECELATLDIRGNKERYILVDAESPRVRPFEHLIDFIFYHTKAIKKVAGAA